MGRIKVGGSQDTKPIIMKWAKTGEELVVKPLNISECDKLHTPRILGLVDNQVVTRVAYDAYKAGQITYGKLAEGMVRAVLYKSVWQGLYFPTEASRDRVDKLFGELGHIDQFVPGMGVGRQENMVKVLWGDIRIPCNLTEWSKSAGKLTVVYVPGWGEVLAEKKLAAKLSVAFSYSMKVKTVGIF